MSKFQNRLNDVDHLISAHERLTGRRRAKPTTQQQQEGAAITRAGIVLLCAAIEGFIEDIFEEVANSIAPASHTTRLENELFKPTTRKLNTPNSFNTNMLFANLGIWWLLDEVRWQKFSPEDVRKWLAKVIETRGQIAHGKQPRVNLVTLRSWRQRAQHYAERIEAILADVIRKRTGANPPGWANLPLHANQPHVL